MSKPVCSVCAVEIGPNTVLHRINKKGEPGIWACEQCTSLRLPDDLGRIHAAGKANQATEDTLP